MLGCLLVVHVSPPRSQRNIPGRPQATGGGHDRSRTTKRSMELQVLLPTARKDC